MLIGPAVAMLLAVLQDPTTPPGLGETPPPAQDTSRTEDGEDIEPPKRKKYVGPEWPENARRVGLNGVVVLECVIGVDGGVRSVTVLKGFQSLAQAAEKAVRKWRYTPTMLRGKAVPVIMTITVNFKQREQPKREDLLASVADPDPEIRWAAMKWLGRYRPITASQRAAVERGLQDTDESVRKAAKEALERFEVK